MNMRIINFCEVYGSIFYLFHLNIISLKNEYLSLFALLDK